MEILMRKKIYKIHIKQILILALELYSYKQQNNFIMKKVLVAVVLACPLIWAACNTADSRYVDLNTGEAIELEKDESSGLMVNTETKKPVGLYVDTRTNDTIDGKSGKVVNGKIVKNGSSWDYDAKYKMDSDGDWKIKDGDYKKKVEADGDVKIKDGDTKIKIDAETGDTKVKND